MHQLYRLAASIGSLHIGIRSRCGSSLIAGRHSLFVASLCLLLSAPLMAESQVIQARGAESVDVRTVDIIAVEYPPYTSQHLPDSGIAFKALSEALERLPGGRSDIIVQPKFLPPGRASFQVNRGEWSASFYPPKYPGIGYSWIKLDDKPVELGLFRLRYKADPSPDASDWPDLNAMRGRVAVGRQADLTRQNMQSALMRSNMELVEVDSLAQGFQLLMKDRVDYVFSEKVAGFLIAKALTTDEVVLEFTDKPLFTTHIGLWVNRRKSSGAELYQTLKDD